MNADKILSSEGAGLSDEGLTRLVELFYARVRQDAQLGPIFENAIDEWPEHLDRLTAFWSSVMLSSGRYKGDPVAAHLRHRERITPALFTRWLAIWRTVTDEALSPPTAAAMQAKASRIAESLQLALFFKLDAKPTGQR